MVHLSLTYKQTLAHWSQHHWFLASATYITWRSWESLSTQITPPTPCCWLEWAGVNYVICIYKKILKCLLYVANVDSLIYFCWTSLAYISLGLIHPICTPAGCSARLGMQDSQVMAWTHFPPHWWEPCVFSMQFQKQPAETCPRNPCSQPAHLGGVRQVLPPERLPGTVLEGWIGRKLCYRRHLLQQQRNDSHQIVCSDKEHSSPLKLESREV